MASAAGIRAGAAYVEIFARDGAFQQAMGRVQAKMRAVAVTLQRFGTGMSLTGAALGAPLVLAARQAAAFQDALLGMQAAAGLSQDEIKALSDEAKRLSSSMGAAPEAIANAFLELTKAGMSVQDVLDGAGKSAVEFARISGVDAARAAVFMKTSMNVFGISAKEAVDTLSAAADSSETSIAAMIESFSQVGSAGKAFNQSLFGISQAMAALAKSNIVGEEAGTAIKTMLTKLVAPTDDAQEALGRLGLSVADFRDEMGQLLPMAQIAGVFERALAKMGGNAEDVMMAQQALVDVFEQRGIKVITAFANIGEKGFKDIEKQMLDALPVSEKFTITMSGITGQFERLSSAVKRVSIEFGEAMQGPLKSTVDVLVRIMDAAAALIYKFPGVAVAAAGIVAGMVALGAVAIVAALAIKGLAVAFAALTSPIGLALAAVVLFAYENASAFEDLEAMGMRVQAAWRKVGIYVAAVFDRLVYNNMDKLLAEVDAELAAWEMKHAQEKRERRSRAENEIRPDAFRKPMGAAPVAAGGKQNNFVSAGTFGSTQGLGIGPQLNKLDPVVANTKRTADGVEKIVEHFKANPREPKGQVIDTRNGDVNNVPGMVADRRDLPWWAPRDVFDALGGPVEDNISLEQAMRQIREMPLGASIDKAAAAAESGTRKVSFLDRPIPALSDGFKSVSESCQDTTAAVKESNSLLSRMLAKLDGVGGVYA